MYMTVKKTLTTLFLTLLFLFGFAGQIHAQTQEWTEGVCVDNGVATVQGLQCLLGNVLSVAVSFIGLAGFVMMIIGAFKYLLAGTNPKAMDEGKNTITFAVGGLIVALTAYMVLQIVSNFTGVKTILDFKVPSSNTQF